MKRILFFLAMVCTSILGYAQSVTITQPNGSEQLYSCQTYQIKWTATGTSNFWSIDYSLNNGAIWTSVATNLSVNPSGGVYNYSWTIPFVSSPTALVRVRDYNDTLKQDVSNAAFSISYPITVLSPNGGETWQGLSQQTISWSAQGTSGVFAIEYSLNNGTSWGTIATSVTGNNYVWTVPNSPSTQALIRVRDNANTCQNDISNATFTITPATPIVTAPNGGETWTVNSNRTITWNTSTYYSNVDIEYSTNGGSTWTSIASNQSNSGSYSWLIPNTPSTNARVRVSNTANPTINDVSDAVFTILMPTPQVTYPNGGEQLDVFTSATITWNSASYVSPVRIEYSTNGGVTWTLLTSSTSNSGSYSWTVPNTPTTNALVRIFNTVYTTFGDTSNAAFTIRPIVSVTYPNLATDTLRSCQSYNIAYNKTPASQISYFYLYYSTNGGASYNYITSRNNNGSTANTYAWTVPYGTNSNNCKIKIEAYNTSAVIQWVDSSDNAFPIVMPQGNINITAPNGGVVLNALTTYNVSWTANGTSGTYDLYYCTNGGGCYNYITTVTGNNYTWTVPNMPSTNVFFIVGDGNDQCKFDTSNAANTIVAAKPVLIAPNGGETWNVSTTQNITWTQSTLYSNARLEYSTDAGATWNSITTSTTNNGSYGWTIPNAPTTQALVRISNVANNAIADTSNAIFTISQPQITVTAPTALSQLQVGQTYNIQWSTGPGVTNVRLEYSTNGGTTWNTIVTSTTNDGNENWTVPNIAGTQTVIRVSNAANLLVNGQSPQFKVLQPITVTTPNGGENLVGCQAYNIVLTKSPYIGNIVLRYSVDGGLNWAALGTMVNNSSATQTYSWTVPNMNANQVLVLAYASGNEAQRDSSDGLFTITRSQDITVTTPPNTTTTLTPGQNYIISWTNTANVSGIYQLLWQDSVGNNYTIANNVTGNNYIWTVPNNPGGSNRFYVYDQNNTCRYDLSSTFRINAFSPQLLLPNGGEQLDVGTTYYIDWNENTYYNNVRIEYSINGGLTWTLIANNYANGNGSYPWTVPNIPSSNCLVRVLTTNNLMLGDTSNATFTIKRPLVITSPANNDTIVDCNNISIVWLKTPAAGTSTTNTMSYSADNGVTWNTIGTLAGTSSTSQSYSWTSGLPGPGTYLVRVINNAGYGDTTDIPFTIIPFNGITVVTPNGGQVWGAGTTQLIGWNAQAGISTFSLQYSLNGGLSYNTIANNQPGYSYSWILPNVNSTNVLVRVVDNANSCRGDASNAPLTITPLQPILTSPNGGEVWNVNSSQVITWNTTTFHSQVKLAYSMDNGANWILITNSTSNSGSYNWAVPNAVSTQCRVRAANVQDTTWFDVSDAVFSIVQPKPILTYPNGGEVLDPGSTAGITWNASSVNSTNVRLEFSNNNGFTWSTIIGSTSNSGSYNSYSPVGSNYALTQCLIRIVNLDFPTQMDTSNAVYTINPYVRVTYPNLATDTIRSCQPINVAFRKYPQGTGTYYGYYSTNNGATWDYFNSVSTTAGNTNYSMQFNASNTTPPGPIKFKVSFNSDPYLQSYVYQDSSDAAGVVVYPPIDITVTAPNGGETLTALSPYTITWTNGPSVSGTYRLRYFSTTSGLTTIASSVTGNSYVWTVPNVVNPGNDWKIRVEDQSNICKIDSSNNFFTIVPATPIVTVPNGGEFWGASSNQNITWNSNTFFTTTVKIEYSLDGGATWNLINATAPNDGIEPWSVPNVQSNTALIRISTTSAPILSDVSNAAFTVGYPTPILTGPNSGTFEYSQPITISWDVASINSTQVRLEYSTDSMQTWSLITSTLTSVGSYAWTVPNVTTTKFFIRAMNTLNLNVWDANNTAMTILRPMRLTSFNTTQNLVGCQTVTFTLARSPYIIENSRVQYSIDGGANWINAGSNIASGTPVAQTATWTVPNITATNVMFRSYFTSTTTYADTADVATHTITADYPIAITAPNTAVSLTPGQNYTISWTNTGNVSGIYEIHLYKSGSFVQTIATNVTGNNYIWSVPNNPGTGAFSVRIYDSGNTCKYDSSDVRFTILPNAPIMTAPNGGETWWALQSYNITWNASSFYNSVRLDYSLDSGLTWINITSSTGNSGAYSWTVPAGTPYSTKALVKVSDATNLALFDVSNAVFTLKPVVRILTPNGGATLGACTNSSISFEHSPYFYQQGNTFTIQYTLNNGVSYTNLTTTQSANSSNTVTYNYTLPNSSTTQYGVRVMVTQTTGYSDISDSLTTIRPAVTIIQPNFGGVLQVGSSYQIKWSSDGISNLYNLYYSTAGPTGPYSVIQLNYNTSTNQYLWTVPNAPTTNGYIVIQDATASCKADTSNIAFTISSTANAITVTAPNGGDTLTGCQNYNITWTESGAPAGQYNISYSADAGATFNTIVNNYATTSGSYAWVVPNTINSANVLVRIALSSAPTTLDMSNALLTVQNGRVVATPDTTICQGNSVQLFATGGNNVFSWTPSSSLNNANIPNPIATPSATITYTATSNNNGCILSDTARVNVVPGGVVTAGVSISASPSTGVCSGTSVTFTATPSNGGTTPGYQWKKNGNNVGLNSPVYVTNTIANNDVITCVMTSNASCVTGNPATSNAVTMTVFPTVAPSVSISASTTSICAGASVTFTATPTNGGGTPSYQWKVNGTNQGTNSNIFSSSSLNNNDIVSVEMTSSASCATPTIVSSNSVQITVNQFVTPTIAISTGATTVCSGQSVQFTANITNGGAAPAYQWKKNGSNVGTGLATYTTTTLTSGDIITCVLTSNAPCANPAQVTSNALTMTVTSSVVPAVTIVANDTDICAGTTVNFTATPVNGGATPSYQWKVNTNNVGTNSASYSSNSLANNDVVTVVMTSSSGCASPTTATSPAITMIVNPTSAPSVNVTSSATTICSGTQVTFTANATNAGNTPTYQWSVNNNPQGGNSNTFITSTLSSGDVVRVTVTSSSTCASPNTATSNIVTVTVNSNAAASVSIAASNNNICAGANVTFTATPTNGGTTPSYQWKLNGNNVGSNSASYSSTTLTTADVVTVVMTSNAACATPNVATSNAVSMTVTPVAAPSVSIATASTTICAGTPVTFTATSTNEGSAPSYQWKVNGSNQGTNSPTFTTSSLTNGQTVSVVLTSNATCASPLIATSNTLNMTVNPSVTSSVQITASATSICAGANVTFTASPTNGGATPSYQWKVNGNNTGTNSAIFASATLNNNDVVTVVLTSNAACASSTTATSNAITITVGTAVTPAVSISTPNTTICAGVSVSFTATATNGVGTPAYQWKVNGNNVGTNSAAFTTTTLANSDIVTVVLTSNATCATSTSATSNSVTMTVTPSVTPAVSISASATTICAGASVTFTATPTNGGAAPTYQWKVNGNSQGTNSATFTTTTLNNNDLVSVVMTSNAACAATPTVTSTGIAVTVNPLTAPTISVSASATTICSGASVTFNAAVTNAGTTPTYQWKVNGNNVGANAASYSSTTLNNNDVVTCELTSSNSCAGTTTVTSTPITITVNTSVTPAVAIATGTTSICAGASVTFTATPTNGGSTPSYQWKINGNNAGTNSATFTTTTLANSDVVTVVLTSNVSCVTQATATSNSITMSVGSNATPTIAISTSSTTVCAGASVTFTAAVTNGGTTPSYQWKVNGNNQGTNAATFSTTSLANGAVVTCVLTSNATCVTQTQVTSNAVTMSVNPVVTPSVSIQATSTTICAGISVTFAAAPTNGGNTPSYQWLVNGSNQGANSATFTSTTLNNGDIVTVVMTSSAPCPSQATATSNAITMVVNPSVAPTVSVTPSTNNICAGTSVTFTATATNAGITPVYQWKVNGNNQGGNSTTFTSTTLANSDIVTVELTSNASCAVPNTATSSGITMSVSAVVAPTIAISSTNSVCVGGVATFSATITNGGAAPSYQWKVNGNNQGTNSAAFSSSSLVNGDVLTCELTSNANCANPVTVTSNQLAINQSALVTPTVQISASATNICSGTSVTFTATPSNGGNTPSYQWLVNGNNAGANSATFVTSTLNNSDVVSVVLTSSAGCVTSNTATSNTITVTVGTSVTPSVSISASASNICAGSSVTFTATPTNGGATPSYQWQVNGIATGTNSASFTTSALSNNDGVTVVMTSSAACASPLADTSNSITVTVNPVSQPTVSISTPSASVCTGSSVTFTAVSANAGSSPSYQWLVNGNNAGVNSATFTSATLNNNDIVTVVVTSSNVCGNGATNTSNAITMTISSSLTPSVSVQASATTICTNSSVTFTATPTNGGSTPNYQWKVNGSNQGTNSATFTTTTTLVNGDVVTVEMTSSETCVNGAVATSSPITITTTGALVPTVSVSASNTTICPGTSVTFTATATNAGTTPTYQWKVNGNNQGGNSATFTSSTLANNDVVTVQLTSSEQCASPNPVTSSPVAIAVGSGVLPTVTVGVTPAAAVCANTNVVFTATPTFGGTTPTYVWKVNGNVQGSNSAVFSSNTLSNGDIVTVEMTSNETCVSQATVLSTPQTITVHALPAVPTVSQSGNVLTSSAVTGNQWLQNGAPISGASSQVYTINATGYYAVQVTNNNGCSVKSDSVQFVYIGVEEIVLKDAVQVMPNPFVEYVMVNIAGKVNDLSALHLSVTNELGQLIFETNKLDYINKFDFSQRASGVYYIHIHDGKQRNTFKVIKQN